MAASHGQQIALAAALLLAVAAVALFAGGWDDSDDGTVTVVTVCGEGVADITGAGVYEEGERIYLVALIEYGYMFDGWYGEDGALLSDSIIFETSAEDGTVYARATSWEKPKTFLVSVESDGGIEKITGAGEYKSGEEVVLRATLKPGYAFAGWYYKSGKLLSSSPAIRFDAMDLTLKAKSVPTSAEPATFFVVAVGDDGIREILGTGEYAEGTSVTLTAVLEPGWTFEGWYDANWKLLSAKTRYTVPPISGNVGLQAVSIEPMAPPVQKTVAIDAERGPGIDEVYGDGEYFAGDAVMLSAYLLPGYSFDGWYDEHGNQVSNRQDYVFTASVDMSLTAISEPGFTVRYLGMPGLTTDNLMEYGCDDEPVTCPVEGKTGCFAGWYDLAGDLMTDDMYFMPPRCDGVYVAKTDLKTFQGPNRIELEYPEEYDESWYWVVLDYYTNGYVGSGAGRSAASIGVANGSYRVIYYNGLYDWSAEYYEGTAEYYEGDPVTFGADARRYFYWNYAGEDFAVYITGVSIGMYSGYNVMDDIPEDWELGDLALAVDYKDKKLAEIAAFLKQKSDKHGWDELQRADFVLKFVQLTTEYELDDNYEFNYDQGEYWKHPMETLLGGRGDCEDTAILFVSLMKAMGDDAVLLGFTSEVSEEYEGIGHAAAAVSLDCFSDDTYSYPLNGKKYYYCETTNEYYVGDKPDVYGIAMVISAP